MVNDTTREQPQCPKPPEKEQSAGGGASFPCQGWMERMMAACKQMRAACCGEPEEAKPPK